MKIDFTLWPNPDPDILDTLPDDLSSQVTLGTNKIQIPEDTQWPDGDTLVGNFIYKDGLLSGFVDTKALIRNDSNTTKIPYDYVNTTLEGLNGGNFIILTDGRCKSLKVSFGDSYKNDDYQKVTYDTASEIVKNYLYNASQIIGNTLYDANMNVSGAFDMNSISIPYSEEGRENSSYEGEAIHTFFTDGSVYGNNSKIKVIKSDMRSLTDGYLMFYHNSTLETFEGDLSSLTNGNRMFGHTKISSFEGDLSSLTNGDSMFTDCSNLTSFSSDLSSLTNGEYMFLNCSNLTTFTSDLSSLTNGQGMFNDCSNLTTFTSDLSSLTHGAYMFINCSNLTTFTSDLSSLTHGGYMFSNCSSLTTFNSDLSSLTDGYGMLANCANLTTFTSDLSSLTTGRGMFADCSRLTTFNSDLSSLTDGQQMFYRCKLNPQSVMNIVKSLPKRLSGGKITIGISVTNNVSTIQQQLQAFAEEATFDSWADLKQAFVDKGWNVILQYGGLSTSIPYDMRGERDISCSIYAQLIEEEDKDHAEYTNEDGSKFYNINWGHDVTNPQEFQQFDSLEDAAAAYGVFIKENIETV